MVKKAVIFLATSLLLLYGIVVMYFYQVQADKLFPGRTIPQDAVYGFSLPHEELWLEASDGARLNAVLFRAASPQGAVLHFHGNGENLMDMEPVAAPFVQRGYDVLAMDYRTYGKSTGELSEANLFRDARLFMQFLEEQGWQQNEILVYGRSIGTGIATQLASTTKPRALVLFSPYSSMHKLVSERYAFLPVDLILQYPLNSAENIQTVDCPILILHGDEDPVIPISHAQQLAEIKGKLITFAGGDHDNLPSFEVFWQEVDALLAETE